MAKKNANGDYKQQWLNVAVKSNIRQARVRLEGINPILPHRFDEKSRKVIDEKHTKGQKAPLENRDPIAEAIAGLYLIGARPSIPKEVRGLSFEEADGLPLPFLTEWKLGFPAAAFRLAIVTAAGMHDGLHMTKTTIAIMVGGSANTDLVELVVAGTPRCRVDRVNIGKGASRATTLRSRIELPAWSTILPISYNRRYISSPELFCELVMDAGLGVGVGDWRAEKKGVHGTWNVAKIEVSLDEDERGTDEEAA